MDWNLALQHNHTLLLRHVAWLFTWLKLEVGESIETLPRLKRYTILFVLRPAESACRRLIVVRMYLSGIVAPKLSARGKPSAKKSKTKTSDAKQQVSLAAFRLLDPRKKFDLNPNAPKYAKGPGPRITTFWSGTDHDRSDIYAYQERLKRLRESTRGKEHSAKSVCRRMNALMAALQDLDKQAARMARLLARNERRHAEGKPAHAPIRPGPPPGRRQRRKHEIDEILRETHHLAFLARNEFPPP